MPGGTGTFWTDLYWTQWGWGQGLRRQYEYLFPYKEADPIAAAGFAVAEFGHLAKENNAKAVVVNISWFDNRLFNKRISMAMADAAAETGVHYISTYPIMKQAKEEGKSLVFASGHLNAEGHRIVGDLLFQSGREANIF